MGCAVQKRGGRSQPYIFPIVTAQLLGAFIANLLRDTWSNL